MGTTGILQKPNDENQKRCIRQEQKDQRQREKGQFLLFSVRVVLSAILLGIVEEAKRQVDTCGVSQFSMRKWFILGLVGLEVWVVTLTSGQNSNSARVPKPPAAGDSRQPSTQSSNDEQPERELLDLANQARTQAGVPALKLDEGLSKAARTHSQKMASQRELSHQLTGELDLQKRLAEDSNLQMDHVGENVGYAETADDAHAGFMESPPHRKNLLDPLYNVLGIGVVRSNGTLYVTEDFGHSLPPYSESEAQRAVADSIARVRSHAGLTALKNVPVDAVHQAACAMSKTDSLRGEILPAKSIVRYTAITPSDLPNGMEKVLNDAGLSSFSVGVCFGRTNTYPNGIYWVFLVLN